MNKNGNPKIAEYGEKTRLIPGCCHDIQSKGTEAAKQTYIRRRTYKEIATVYGQMDAEELEGLTNDEAVIVALFKQAKKGNVQAIDKLLNLFGELVTKMEMQMTPAEYLAKVREKRNG